MPVLRFQIERKRERTCQGVPQGNLADMCQKPLLEKSEKRVLIFCEVI